VLYAGSSFVSQGNEKSNDLLMFHCRKIEVIFLIEELRRKISMVKAIYPICANLYIHILGMTERTHMASSNDIIYLRAGLTECNNRQSRNRSNNLGIFVSGRVRRSLSNFRKRHKERMELWNSLLSTS
jgi:hypothetical protein